MKTPGNNLTPVLLLGLLVLLAAATNVAAYDTEGCLSCHQYRGLSRIDSDGKSIELFLRRSELLQHAAGPALAASNAPTATSANEVETFPASPANPRGLHEGLPSRRP